MLYHILLPNTAVAHPAGSLFYKLCTVLQAVHLYCHNLSSKGKEDFTGCFEPSPTGLTVMLYHYQLPMSNSCRSPPSKKS